MLFSLPIKIIKVSNLLKGKCVLILSIDDLILQTDFMYVMFSITLSSITSVIIINKINARIYNLSSGPYITRISAVAA